jgi:hypothetical protein
MALAALTSRPLGANATAQSIRGSITNPARLNRERQLEICMQCHLKHQFDGRDIRRYDRGPFSYRPDSPSATTPSLIMRSKGSRRDLEVAHAAYRREIGVLPDEPDDAPPVTIRMTLQGAGRRFSSITRQCARDATPLPPSGNACHALSAASSCIDRHAQAPTTTWHVVMTDHYIQRRKPSRLMRRGTSAHRACTAAR